MKHPSLSPVLVGTFVAIACGGLAVACGSGAGVGPTVHPDPNDPNGPGLVDNGFESDDPSGRTATRTGGAGEAADASAGAPSASNGAGDAQRTVEEADIIKLDGGRLYALSRYGGLGVVDVSDPDHMKMLGRKRTDGIPFEMYVKNDRAYVMLVDSGRWLQAPGSYYGQWVQTSEIVALNVSDPANVTEIAHYDVPGTIADSRLVGDALYLVTYENGYCWNCQTKPATIVTSFNVAGASIAKVDQLAFTAPNSSYSYWQRSVSATSERLYIAGPQWDWSPTLTRASSVIQVVDITDPGGKLAKGADVPVDGQINSRWQMDESAGVLRVVSQFGNGWAGPNGSVNPVVQTFTIASAMSITPLGRTEIAIPHPETLQSVRFDGPRAYAITSQQMDPLFTIDLSDPAHPKQAGELAMPGWIIYMEPRGDRLVGFGYDNTNPSAASLAVSLFDVSDLTKPALLKRVSFGNGWGSFAEDKDRIQKSVQILDDQGLVLVPFASYGWWGNGTCTQPQSGIQLIDFSHDDLVLRGLAPQYGMPRRAFLTGGRLLAMSDRNVTSFDITSRDAPKKTFEIDLSNPAYRIVEVQDQIASITSDWWTGEVVFSLTPKANADDAAVTGKLSLASLAKPSASTCSGPQGWTAWYDARLFANGSLVYFIVPVYSYDAGNYGGSVVVAAIETADPLHPRIVGKAEMPLSSYGSGYGWYGGFWDGYAYYSYYGGLSGSLVGSGQGAVRVGTKLGYLEVRYESVQVDLGNGKTRYDEKVHRTLHVVDFADPASPVVKAPIDLGASLGASPLHLLDGVVHTSRWMPSNAHPGKVRFYVDRVDLNPSDPVRLPSINTPGSLLSIDQPSQRFVTVDYAATHAVATDWSSCQVALGWRAYFDYDTNDCVSIARTFKLADFSNGRVTLRDSFVPPSQNIGGIAIADDRVYVTRYARYDYYSTYGGAGEPRLLEDGGLWAIGGIRAGKLAIVSQLDGDAQWPLAVRGAQIALYTDGGLAIYDTVTPTPTLVKAQNLRGWGYTSDVLLGDDRAICALDEWGLQTVRY